MSVADPTGEPTEPGGDEEFGLIVNQAGSGQLELIRFLSLALNYLYGYNLILARTLKEAAALQAERGDAVRHIFIVQGAPVSGAQMGELTRDGQRPLFLLLPQALVDTHRSVAESIGNVHLLSWEEAGEAGHDRLRQLVDGVLREHGIGGLFDRAQHVSYRVLQQRVERRLKHLHTLPTLPEVVLRIMEVISDPDSTAEALEEVLRSDPAIVHKLMQVVNTAAFAGRGHRGRWRLKEAIVRLGRRKLGSIALQIKLINSLIKPEESHFDLRRFWIHSVGSAHLADRLYNDKLVDLGHDVQVNEYWVAALLHDIGKLVLGFFFWTHFDRVAELVVGSHTTFAEAEQRLGAVVSHEQVGQLLLMRATMGEIVVRSVAGHHTPDAVPDPLMCLVHLADNLCKDLGLGYLPEESGHYDPAVLRVLHLDEAGVEALRSSLAETAMPEIMDIVDRCTMP